MASQSESNPKPRDEETEESSNETGDRNTGGTQLETQNPEPAPFSEFDPFRTSRLAALREQTDALCQTMGIEPVGLEQFNEAELRQLASDAEERSKWSQAKKDAFAAILRLGYPTPPRTRRIL